MNVDFTPEQEARLAQVASKAGTAPEKLAAHVIVRYLDEETRFLSAVEKGLAAAGRRTGARLSSHNKPASAA